MATISYSNLADFDLPSINSGLDDLDAHIDAINAELDALPDPDLASLTTQTDTLLIADLGDWTYEIHGSGLTSGVATTYTQISYIKYDGTTYETIGRVGPTGGTVTSISISDSSYSYQYIGAIKINSNFDYVKSSLTSYTITTPEFTINVFGKLTIDLNTGDIGGNVNGLYLTDSSGHTIDVSGISIRAALFDSLTDASHGDLTDLYNAISTGSDAITGGSDNDHLLGGAGNDTLDGSLGIDTLEGGKGNDTFLVDDEHDEIIEGVNAGTDLVKSTAANYVLSDNVENITLLGTGDFNASGNSLANTMIGNNGNNAFLGGGGADILKGGLGSDTYTVNLKTTGTGINIVGSLEDNVTELLNQGEEDRVILQGGSTITKYSAITLGANIEILDARETGTAKLNLTGNTLNNTLFGNSADNILNGGTAVDTFAGGDGNDNYVLDQEAELDNITELDDEGTDLVQISYSNTSKTIVKDVDLTAHANLEFIENVTLTGTGLFNITGNAQDNYLTGNVAANMLIGAGGRDTLVGGGGLDTLIGGEGDDKYIVTNPNVVIIELPGSGIEGIDTIVANFSVDLRTQFEGVENIILTGKAALNATGHNLTYRIEGNDGNNILSGEYVLIGGKGNDTYIVQGVVAEVIETLTVAQGGGTDTVKSSAHFTLSDNVENLILTSDADLIGNGNILANVITGNAGNNILNGYEGNDSLIGGAGNDQLTGGLGRDTLNGGAGDDTYYVTLAVSGPIGNDKVTIQDTIVDAVNGGNDTVILVGESLSYFRPKIFLGANLENLDASLITNTILSTSSGISLYGNKLDNYIIGNAAQNYLFGDAGNDTLDGGDGEDTLEGGIGANILIGGDGGDTYFIRSASDHIIESSSGFGEDHIVAYTSLNLDLYANIEYSVIAFDAQNVVLTSSYGNVYGGSNGKDVLVGSDGNDIFQHSAGNDIFNGGSGNDIFYSGQGNDTFTGGSGEDTFIFDTLLRFNGVDKIKDFATGEDEIQLHHVVFPALEGGFTVDQFYVGNAAQSSDQHIIYNQTTGNLFYDQDGLGGKAQVLFANLGAGTELHFADFSLI